MSCTARHPYTPVPSEMCFLLVHPFFRRSQSHRYVTRGSLHVFQCPRDKGGGQDPASHERVLPAPLEMDMFTRAQMCAALCPGEWMLRITWPLQGSGGLDNDSKGRTLGSRAQKARVWSRRSTPRTDGTNSVAKVIVVLPTSQPEPESWGREGAVKDAGPATNRPSSSLMVSTEEAPWIPVT